MAALTGQTVASTYPTLLKLDNVPLTSVYKVVETGNGDDSALQLSTLGIKSSGVLETTGNATVGGTLAVTGATTLAAVTAAGAAVCSTTLGVTGAATLGSTLGVTGATTLSSTANIVGAVTCQSTLSSVGTMSALGNMTVAGTATVSGGVIGDITGNSAGVHTGNVVGNVTGNVTGNSAGVHTGNVTGDVTGNASGNAGTATTLQTSRTIQLTGDVTGSASFNGSANAVIAATLAAPITPTTVSDQANSSTGYFDVPSGTTAQRPGSPNSGNIRYNSTDSALEYYNGTAWSGVPIGAAAKAYVRFSSLGVVMGTPLNVSSVVRNGTGSYTVTLSINMGSVNYVVNATSHTPEMVPYVVGVTTTAFNITSGRGSFSYGDAECGVTVY